MYRGDPIVLWSLNGIEHSKKDWVNVHPKVASNEEFDEATLKLEYKDNKGNLHTEYVIGYFKKGYLGKIHI